MKHKTAFLTMLTMATILTTIDFNPVVVGGYKQLFKTSRVANIIETIQQKEPGSWIVFDNYMASNLFRAMGIYAYSGVLQYPHKSFWQNFDPELKNEDIWNRYSHVQFHAVEQLSTFHLFNPHPDTVIIETHPDNVQLLKVPFKYVMTTKKMRHLFDTSKNYQALGETETFLFYKRKEL